jgi:hypothetical protein
MGEFENLLDFINNCLFEIKFEPQKNITLQELALCVVYLHSGLKGKELVRLIEKSVVRKHFRITTHQLP